MRGNAHENLSVFATSRVGGPVGSTPACRQIHTRSIAFTHSTQANGVSMNPINDGQTFLFIGDSITDCGRHGPQAPYGDGYVSLFRELFIAKYPERRVTFINKGIGGNTVEDLNNRWEDDVMPIKPDWLSIKIGINDLHRTLGKTENAVPPKRFAELYDRIIARTFAVRKPELILVSPFYISRDFESDSFRSKVLAFLPEYIEVVEKMASKYDARYVPMQDIYQKHLEIREADVFCPEPVHPNRTGHMVIAEAIMQAVEK